MANLNRSWNYAYRRPATPNSTNAPLGLAPGATITVFASGTQTPVVLFADAAGIVSLANPFVADANGYFDFYTAQVRIDVQISGTGIQTPYTLGDFQQIDVGVEM
jgi:hypothetical protein